ncbi:CHRD domain-containing protein [Kibdelosporangium aridum]|uniref:CHRD domain-containing protein n=1 Tax=Kibdelosporangium aridum TaxID=2030 RepID=A0A1Y5XIW5_KIBAR|nr:CHRD domain-containing protein [Kibdelosporangium aridum]SMC97063.1 CHRD domain-containing protein [Kibdelosporangium aridum]
MIRRGRLLTVAAAVGAVVALSATASAAAPQDAEGFGGRHSVREHLSSYHEHPLALSTTGNGQFRATLNERTGEITWQLSYADLSGAITQAHIHFGHAFQAGGISAFLCTNAGNGPVGTQTCPAAPATISGTLRAADVIGPAAQGIAAGEFAEFAKAFRAGVTYANVHTAAFPAGEIRAQLDR